MNASFLASDEYADLRSWYDEAVDICYKSDDDADEEENDDELFNQLQISATSTAEAMFKMSKSNGPAHSTSENRKEKRACEKKSGQDCSKDLRYGSNSFDSEGNVEGCR